MGAARKGSLSHDGPAGSAGALPMARIIGLGRLLERENLLGPALATPAVLILAVFVAYPFFYGIWLSLTDATVGQPGTFIGMKNFIDQFQDSVFRETIVNTFEYTFLSCALKFICGLGMAVVLNQQYAGRQFVRAVVLLPWIVPTALSTLAWAWIFDSTFSVINWTLNLVNLKGPIWLGGGHWPMISLILVGTWRGTPFFGICFLAGMQTISEELYEAARIDGANAWQRFWGITFPLLMPVTAVVMLLSLILTLGDFELIYVLTRGGPHNATQVFSTLAYFVGVQAAQLGAGASISLTMFPVLIIVIFLTLRALTAKE